MNEGLNGSPFLENQPNFRSLEGIQTLSGKKIRKNKLYRSGGLNKLSDVDIRKLESIGLAMVIDFRSDREVSSYPDNVIPSVKRTVRIIIPDEARDLAMEYLDKNDDLGLEKVLINDYRRMIRKESDRFAEFFRTLEGADEFPIVFHCAAGKDRTGLASVLLLTALGADAGTIEQDYFQSNIRLKSFADRIIGKITAEGKNGEILRPMMEVRPEYLKAALDEINLLYEDMNNYLFNVLEVNSVLLAAKYLE